jgi:hypothetical protein
MKRGDDDASRAARRLLLEHNVPMLLLGVGKARAARTWSADQIGLIVDVDDRVGQKLVVATGGKLADAEVFRKNRVRCQRRFYSLVRGTSNASSGANNRTSRAPYSSSRHTDGYGSSSARAERCLRRSPTSAS